MTYLLALACGSVALASTASSFATETNWVGSGLNWSSVSWHAMPAGINDGVAESAFSSYPEADFVGNSANPGGYWSTDTSYAYFRMRVATPTLTAIPNDSFAIMVDLPGVGTTNLPDYAFTWDAKSDNNTNHGLEMQVLATTATGATTWGAISLDDRDGANGSKGLSDINGNSRTTDGYVRSVDSQSTTNLGTTTFIDIAVSWTYLSSYVPSLTNANFPTWRFAFGTMFNATDHNALNGDIAGSSISSSISTGWTNAYTGLSTWTGGRG